MEFGLLPNEIRMIELWFHHLLLRQNLWLRSLLSQIPSVGCTYLQSKWYYGKSYYLWDNAKGKQEIRLAPSLRSGIYVLNIQSKTQVFRTIITKK